MPSPTSQQPKDSKPKPNSRSNILTILYSLNAPISFNAPANRLYSFNKSNTSPSFKSAAFCASMNRFTGGLILGYSLGGNTPARSGKA